MPDVFTKQKRSQVMSRIRSRGNKATELALMAFFRRHKITGWRRHFEIRQSAIGNRQFRVRPDFVFPKLKLAVFVDGCFWHGCPRHATWPKSNAAFWRKKLSRNRTRDRSVGRTLRKTGWQVLRIWEHALRTLRWATKQRAADRQGTVKRMRDEPQLLVKFASFAKPRKAPKQNRPEN